MLQCFIPCVYNSNVQYVCYAM